ncbi:MAG: ABC transporter ATP-binding protein [Phycisphaerae bacterium]|jgi:putative ABC transport system ATP-binding protein|nr:ABC transporter ATP-binding protein [Phycisphaerae bacterium]
MGTANDYILTAKKLYKSYVYKGGRVEVLHGLDMAVKRGEFLAVMGPSGCGKSTLMHILGLISRPESGVVTIDSHTVTNRNRERTQLRRTMIGLIFQRFNLISVLSAENNVNMSLRVRGIRPDGRTGELLEALGVAHVAKRKPSAMSIGEQQRVAVARALAHRPKVLLADEPTGSLDSVSGHALMDILKKTNRDDGQTIVMITHSEELAGYADRIVYMQDGLLVDHN